MWPALRFARISYSQEGEDILLMKIFKNKKKGFYVDVGAHHPYKLSNTYLLYKLKWHGLNIEPNNDGYILLKKYRKRDINLNVGISNKNCDATYFEFNEPALNTFDEKIAYSHQVKHNTIISGRRQLYLRRLDDLLDEHVSKNTKVDLLNIDVEGLELSVLKSYDWSKYRPHVICIETLRREKRSHKVIDDFLSELNYINFSRLYNSTLYIDNDT